MLKGVFPATKKDGTIYYRTSINYSGKHISLGSFASEEMAHLAYKEASQTREFDTLKSKKVPQSLEIGLFFCQIFIFII